MTVAPAWHQLPDLVLREIFGLLEKTDLRKTAGVCRRWRTVSRSVVQWSISITTAELGELSRAQRNLRDAFPGISDLVVAKTAPKTRQAREPRSFSSRAALIALLGSRPRHVRVVESADASEASPTVEDVVLATCVRPTNGEETKRRRRVGSGRISPYENMYDRVKLSLASVERATEGEGETTRPATPSSADAGRFVRELFSRTQMPRPAAEVEFEFASLETVDVSGCHSVDDETIKSLRDAGVLGERLSFAGCPRVTADGLAEALGAPRLRILDASNTDVSGAARKKKKRRRNAGDGAADALPPSTVEMLSLHGSKIGSDCAKQLVRCVRLATLDLSDVEVTTSQPWDLPIAVRNLPNLERIDVSGWQMAVQAAIACAVDSLRSVRIDRCPRFDRACLEVVLYKATSLRRLVLTGDNLLTTREALHEITEAKARRGDVPWSFVTVISTKPDTDEVIDMLRGPTNLNDGGSESEGDGEGRSTFIVPADEVMFGSSYEPLGTDALLAFAPSGTSDGGLDRRDSIYDEFGHRFFVRKVEVATSPASPARKRPRAKFEKFADRLREWNSAFVSKRPRIAATGASEIVNIF